MPGDKISVMASNTNTNQNSTTTDSRSMENVAKVKGAVRDKWLGVVRAECRTSLLKQLIAEELGSDDVENFVAKQRRMKHCSTGKNKGRGVVMDRVRVKDHMGDKLEDSILEEQEMRAQRAQKRSRLEHLLVKKKSEYKRFINQVIEAANKERTKIKKENSHKVRRIRQERKKDKPFNLPDLLVRYAGAKVFKNEYINNFVQGEVKGPVWWVPTPTCYHLQK